MGFFITTEAACVYTYICIYVHTHTYIRIHPSGIKLWPYLVLVPLLLPKQPWSIEAWTLPETWRCAWVSDTNRFAADPLSPLSQGLYLFVQHIPQTLHWIEIWKFGSQVNTSNSLLCSSNHLGTLFAIWNLVLPCWKTQFQWKHVHVP